jgi:type III secretion system export apparatus protein
MNTALVFDVNTWFLGASLGFARLAPIFFFLPFFNSSTLGGVSRIAVIMVVALGFWPMPLETLAHIELSVYLPAIAQEFLVGLILGVLLGWPFWIFHAVGSFIDNQRGATLSSTIDPANGVDTSELSGFFNFFSAAIYLYTGGLMLFAETVNESYRLCDPLEGCTFSSEPALQLLNSLMTHMIVLASPVIAMLLLFEFILGLLSHFTPQLNAFSISLTVKSVVALVVLLVYFAPILPDEIIHLGTIAEHFPLWIKRP